MHDDTDAIDADPSVRGLAIPQPPTQTFNLIDDHSLRRCPCRVISRQSAGNQLQMVQSHSDMEPVEQRGWRDPSVAEDASQSRTAIGEGGQDRVPGAPDGLEVPTDQRFDVGISSDDGAWPNSVATACCRSSLTRRTPPQCGQAGR